MVAGRAVVPPVESPCLADEAADGDDGAYELDDDPARVDLDRVWGFLSTEAY